MKLLQKIMLSCNKATELMEKKSFMQLSFAESIQLHMHTTACAACRNYQKQIKRLDIIFKKFFKKQLQENIPFIENKDLKERILAEL